MLGFISSWLTPTSLFIILNLVIGTIAIISSFASNKKPQHHNQEDHQYQYQHYHQLPRAPSLIDRVRSINFSLYKFSSNNWDTDHHHHDQQLQEPTTENEHASRVDDPNPPPPLARVPSFLERVASINFSLYKFQSTDSETDNVQPEHANRVDPGDGAPLSRAPSLLERVKSNLSSLYRSDSNSHKYPYHEIDSETEHDEDHHVHVERSKSESGKRTTARALPEKMKKSASEKSGMSRKSSVEEADEEEVEGRRPQTGRMEKTVSFGESGDVDAKADDFINKFKQQLKLQRLDSLLRYRDMMGRGK